MTRRSGGQEREPGGAAGHEPIPGDDRTTGARLAAALHHGGGRPGKRSLVASVLLHAMLLAAIVLSGGLLAEDVPEFQTLRVNIVSPPPVALGEPTPAPEEEAVVPVEAEADPEPVPEPPAVEEKPPEARPAEQKPPETSAPPPPAVEEKKEPEQSTGARPDPESTGGDNLNVVQDGQLFDFPWYTDNIVLQLHRYFRWSGSPDREVGLMFAIERDGSVTSVDIQRRSGNPRFDLAAVQAVNMAARNEEFGPLPDDFVKERLWVRFTFVPQK